ncbi:MAG TPA: peptide ABC transporter substrate-binding protein [Gemmatimonadales bacterium]|nr:peptide ABC transporter substrate-binding protein [Gemmatimonadales bacterium]
MNARVFRGLLLTLPLVAVGCQSSAHSCSTCESTVVVAATGEPHSLLPPLVYQSVGRDISDLIFERLADLKAGGSPLDPAAFVPRLAARWERIDSLTWRFRLRDGARWQDGTPVTAEDVRFSFEVFADSIVDAVARTYLANRIRVEVEDPRTVRIRFNEPSPEQLYDATYHVRILPQHVWSRIPRETWAADTNLARLVGSGPYRLHSWKRGQHAILVADTSAQRKPRIGRVIWRFTGDAEAALNLVLSGEADLLESIGSPQQIARFEGDTLFELRSYPAAVYGFLAFRVADRGGKPHPVFGNRVVRRALVMGTDRTTVARALFGKESRAPAGPMSQLLWINSPDVAVLPYDTSAAARALDAAGWQRGPDGVRRSGGTPLAFNILVPSTSGSRRQAAVMLQESWRHLGAKVSVTAVDFPVFQERIRTGKFDAYMGAYLDEPSARGLADGWTRAGWDGLNYGRYSNPVFDSLLSKAARTDQVRAARLLYREALDTLNADAPAIFLYAPANVAAVRRTLSGIRINPYSWLSDLPEWRPTPTAVRTASVPRASP